MRKITQALLVCFIVLGFQGCVVGTIAAAPFHITGEVVNVVAPDIVGDTISAVGDVVDTVIPF